MAVLMSVALLVILVQDIPLGSYLQSTERDRMITSLERDAFVLAGRSEDSLESDSAADHAVIADLAKKYRAAGGARVVIVDSSGIALVTSDDDSSAVGSSYLSRPEIAKALTGQIDSGRRYSKSLNEELLYVSVPVLSGAHVYGAVRLTFPAQVVADAVGARLAALWLVAITTVLGAGILGLIFSTTFTRRLTLLKQSTEHLAAGRLDERADETAGAPELRSLSRSFNVMAERLSASMEQQRSFSADASHQLRTPLTALRLRLEGARSLVITQPLDAVDRLGAAEREVDRLSNIIEGLLQLSTAEASAVPPVITDLAALARERIEHWSPLSQESGVDIRYSGPHASRVLAVPGALEQIIDNLLDNALGVSPPGSSITVTVRPDGDRTAVHVIDEGPGMSESDREHAFERFWRAGSPSTGSGLGLAIVAQLALHCGGSAQLDRAPGGGLDASVTLPTAPPAAPGWAAAPALV